MNPQLNEWNLPHGTQPHNPDGLTPEQITEGGKWRACVAGDVCMPGMQVNRPTRWGKVTWKDAPNIFYGKPIGTEYASHVTLRVHVTTPLPAVKESLTPEPPAAPVQGDTQPASYGEPWGFPLWQHLHQEHSLTLLESEMQEIVRLATPLCCQGIADPEKAIADIRDDLNSLKASLSKIDGMISWEHDSDMNTEMETAMNALNSALAQLNGRAGE